MNTRSFYKVDNEKLARTISEAKERVIYMAPGLDQEIALRLNAAWERLGSDSVNVILDVDTERFRLGYGQFEALKFLQEKAHEKGTLISHQPGIRIGLLIADKQVIVFTPKPVLVTVESSAPNETNAICLDTKPANVVKEIGVGPRGIIDQNIGLDKAHSKTIEKVESELKINPPMRYNVAKTLTVFNSFFEFVELELKSCFISRKEVPLNSDLFGLKKGEKAYGNLKSSFKLLDKNCEISEKKLVDLRKKITDQFLIPITGYGVVILRTKKEQFEKEIEKLRDEIKKFQQGIEAKIDGEINKNKKRLTEALLPAVQKTPPKRWDKFIGTTDKKQKDKEIKELLENEISDGFGAAKKMIEEMEASVVFKGITYELLNDAKFIEAAKKAIPTLGTLHWKKLGILSEQTTAIGSNTY